MVLREDQVRTLMSEIGCNNKAYKKGFTLIEILVVLIIIRVMTGPFSERLSLQKYQKEYEKYQKEAPMIGFNIFRKKESK